MPGSAASLVRAFKQTGPFANGCYLFHRNRLKRTIIKTVGTATAVRKAASRASSPNASASDAMDINACHLCADHQTGRAELTEHRLMRFEPLRHASGSSKDHPAQLA
jgi:hypothetical protein